MTWIPWAAGYNFLHAVLSPLVEESRSFWISQLDSPVSSKLKLQETTKKSLKNVFCLKRCHVKLKILIVSCDMKW